MKTNQIRAVMLTLLLTLCTSANANTQSMIPYLFGDATIIGKTVQIGAASEDKVFAEYLQLINSSTVGDLTRTVNPEVPMVLAKSIVNGGTGHQTLNMDQGSVVTATSPGEDLTLAMYSGGNVTISEGQFTEQLLKATGYSTINSLMTGFEDYSAKLVNNNGPAGTVDWSGGMATFNGVSGEDSYITITGDELLMAKTIAADTKGGVLTINVLLPGSIDLYMNTITPDEDILWNFVAPDNSTVHVIGALWGGAILNANGTVIIESGASGLVVGQTVITTSTIHRNPFEGPPVPEPGALALMGIPLFAYCGSRKKLMRT